MARLAIFMDGGYVDKIARDEFAVRPSYAKLSDGITEAIRAKTLEPVDLFRTFYYHCPPYQGNPPTDEEARRFGQARSFFQALRRLPSTRSEKGGWPPGGSMRQVPGSFSRSGWTFSWASTSLSSRASSRSATLPCCLATAT